MMSDRTKKEFTLSEVMSLSPIGHGAPPKTTHRLLTVIREIFDPFLCKLLKGKTTKQ